MSAYPSQTPEMITIIQRGPAAMCHSCRGRVKVGIQDRDAIWCLKCFLEICHPEERTAVAALIARQNELHVNLGSVEVWQAELKNDPNRNRFAEANNG